MPIYYLGLFELSLQYSISIIGFCTSQESTMEAQKLRVLLLLRYRNVALGHWDRQTEGSRF